MQTLIELCADDVVFEFPFALRAARQGCWQAALGEYLSAIPSRIQFDRLSNLEMHQTLNPDVAIVEMTAVGCVKQTGEPYEMSYVVVLTASNGRIAR